VQEDSPTGAGATSAVRAGAALPGGRRRPGTALDHQCQPGGAREGSAGLRDSHRVHGTHLLWP